VQQRVRAAASTRHSESAARVLSLIGLPPVLALPMSLLAAVRAGASISTTTSVIAFLFAGCVLPTALTIGLVRTGRVSALDLRERGERILPSTVTAAACACAAGVLVAQGAPHSVSHLAVGISIQMALLALLTTRWKVSYHTASASALMLVGYSATSSGALTLLLLLLAMSIAWARVYQRRHTLAQVLVGALTAAPIALLT
jgi:membrane-associated phospholipid phosphatase